jgi:5-methylcytosine-specific restriction endonuclease McrA
MKRASLSPERVEVMRARDRERYVRERERRIAKAMAWNAANREKHLASIDRWRQSNPEKVRVYNRKTGDRRRSQRAETNRKRKALIRGSVVAEFSCAQLDARMDYWGRKCWMCAGPFQEVDHVKPLAAGGAHALCNLRPACKSCNASKGSTWPYRQ